MLTELPAVKRLLPGIFLLLFTVSGFGQPETSVWYFGEHAGIDFRSGAAVPITGSITTSEGTAVACDQNGQLLFYTDGITVFNRHHRIMANGTALKGHTSSMQSALIIPAVGDPSRYYLFTAPAQEKPGGVYYNIVNMNGDDGNGAVEEKNVLLFDLATEKITAAKHCNGKDIWVLTRPYNTSAYYAYLVTDEGVNTNPVVSYGSDISGRKSYCGILKLSPDGSRLVSVNDIVSIELSDFDNSTGIISNTFDLSNQQLGIGFGAEFSTDSRLLYISRPIGESTFVMQFDITLGSAAAINASAEIIAQSNTKGEAWGALQMGPDGYLYVTTTDYYGGGFWIDQKHKLSFIQLPSVKGKGCRFKYRSFELNNNPRGGFPNFMQSYFDKGFSAHNICQTLTVNFKYKRPANTVAVEWEFGDPASGGNNYSFVDEPQHVYSAPGNYSVMLIRTNKCGVRDTVFQLVPVYDFIPDLGNDTVLCEGSNMILSAGPPGVKYYWQDEPDSHQQYFVTRQGKYSVETIAGTCIQHDTIDIIYNQSSPVLLGPDIKLCAGDKWEYTINPEPGMQYKWENSSTDLSRSISVPGKYYLTTSGICGDFTDTVQLIKGICDVWLPNAFTPNGDGRNDIYRVAGADNSKSFQMEIFNRWGNRVFVSDSNEKGWNGLQNGREAPAGSYICMIKFIHAETGESKILKGTFILIR